MPKWSDFGNIWATLRELDVNAIREESERPLSIVCVGHDAALGVLGRLLYRGNQRYQPVEANPLTSIPLNSAVSRIADITRADLLILGVDARQSLTQAEAEAFNRLESLPMPFIVILTYGTQLGDGAVRLSPALSARVVAIPEPAAIDAADALADALLDRLPAELQLSAARRLPGLRAVFSRELIAATSFSNATYSLASGLPEQIPVLNVPFAAADILILTKNQAILVYRLALAHGAAPDFQARMREVLPVLGGAFLWRQAARSLVGLIPVWGLLPKVAIAYGGTYTTGVAAWRWFEYGELVSTEQLKRISQEALAIGRARATEMIARAREAGNQAATRARELGDHAGERARDFGDQAGERARAVGNQATERVKTAGGFFSQLQEWLPFQRKPPAINPPPNDDQGRN